MSGWFDIRINGDCSLLIDLNKEACAEQHLATASQGVAALIRQHQLAGIMEIIPTSSSVMLAYAHPISPRHKRYQQLLDVLTPDTLQKLPQVQGRDIQIPMCYAPEFAVDAEALQQQTGLSWERIQTLHRTAGYTVDMLGFLPGFSYLRGLPKALQVPRKATPALHVSQGSVAVAFQYCGLYPQESPGGWYVIGRTPVRLFDYRQSNPSHLLPGDRVRFSAIDKTEFDFLLNAEYADVIDCD